MWRYCSPYQSSTSFGTIYEGTVLKVSESSDWIYVRPSSWFDSARWLHLPSLNVCERIKSDSGAELSGPLSISSRSTGSI